MKLRGNKPGYRSAYETAGAIPIGIILLLCLYLFGAAAGCYLAKGVEIPAFAWEDWIKLCACVDGMTIALALLLHRVRIYPLLPLIVLPAKGLLTSAWVVWQCTGGELGTYIRCCMGWGVFSAGSLLCLLVSFWQGLSLWLRPGRREARVQTALTLIGILYGILMVITFVQTQMCKWL